MCRLGNGSDKERAVLSAGIYRLRFQNLGEGDHVTGKFPRTVVSFVFLPPSPPLTTARLGRAPRSPRRAGKAVRALRIPF